MNIGNRVQKLFQFNFVSFFANTRKLTLNGAAKNLTPYMNTHHNLNINEHELKKTIKFKLLSSKIQDLSIKDGFVRTEITEPTSMLELNIGLPVSGSHVADFQLPSLIEREMTDPVGIVLEKKVLNMERVRRLKMKKHKRKKFLKRMKFHFRRLRKKKRARKEEALLKYVDAVEEEAIKYDPAVELKEKIEMLRWTAPVTRVHGRLAPNYVVEEYLKKKHLKKLLDERIEICLKKLS